MVQTISCVFFVCWLVRCPLKMISAKMFCSIFSDLSFKYFVQLQVHIEHQSYITTHHLVYLVTVFCIDFMSFGRLNRKYSQLEIKICAILVKQWTNPNTKFISWLCKRQNFVNMVPWGHFMWKNKVHIYIATMSF